MLATLLLAAANVDVAVFAVAAIIVLAGSLGVVLARNPVHAALMLVMTLFGIAVLFVAQEAHFLAAVQVIVYAGAIVVLFLFVIMLLGVDSRDAIATEPLPLQRPLALGLGVLALAELLLLARLQWKGAGLANAPTGDQPGTDVERLGRVLFTDYLLAFEATSILLVIAVVGAVVLARKPSARQRERAREEVDA